MQQTIPNEPVSTPSASEPSPSTDQRSPAPPLKPGFAYQARGWESYQKGDYDNAISDHSEMFADFPRSGL